MLKIWTQTEEARHLQRRFDLLKSEKRIGQAEFARANALPGGPSMVTQHLKEHRPINLAAAKAYARGFGCSLAEISPRLAQEVNPIEIGTNGNLKTKPDELVIPQFKTGGSMGRGLLLRDQPGVIRGWTVNQEWLQKNIKSHTGSANLCIVTGFGDSMKGMFNSGDPLVIDRGVNSVEGDAVYFFRVDNEGFIKRLQRIPGKGLIVLSENKKYETWTIDQTMDFEVFGRVVKAWQGEDF